METGEMDRETGDRRQETGEMDRERGGRSNNCQFGIFLPNSCH
ncbi:hypothetical protein [Okeania sp. SIO2F5]|nr:hypothetical protein [Okeania sp. SIO2F5]